MSMLTARRRHGLLGLVAVAGRALDLGADVRRVIEAHVRLCRIVVDAVPLEVDALLCIAVICWINGRSVAICEWQIMHVLTLGSPARGPVSTPGWQSVQTSALDSESGGRIERLRGMSSREPKNARAASPNDACAGVNTGDVPHRDRRRVDRPRGLPGAGELARGRD